MGSEATPPDDLARSSSHLSVIGEPSTAISLSPDLRQRKKTSTACSVCKKRKTKCSGEHPCDRCIQRGTVAECVIDSSTDLRRRGASERRTEELESDRNLLNSILDTIRSGNDDQISAMCNIVRAETDRLSILRQVDFLMGGSTWSESSIPEGSQPSSPQSDRRRESQSTQPRPRGNIRDLLNHDFAQEEAR